MRLTRSFVVTMVTVILLAMTAPAAQAQAIERPQPVLHSPSVAWLGFAVTWLTRLAGGEGPANSRVTSRTMSSTLPLPPPTGTGGGHFVPMTGPCIDPMGVGRCN
jgi:hypothetical protein